MNFEEFSNTIYSKHFTPLKAAYEAASKSKGVGGNKKQSYRLGASLIDRPFIICSKSNSYKTHPFLAKYSPFPCQHAETAVILSHGLDDCKGLSLYVLRITRTNQIAMAKPCKICQALIEEVGISECYYTTENSLVRL